MGTSLGQPSQFVGYWGQGDTTVLAAKLQHILERSSVAFNYSREGRWRGEESGSAGGWAIASTAPLLTDGVTLNACGRSQPTALPGDAWVIVRLTASDQPLGTVELRLGRDPFGRVPLYWLALDSVIWFASRMQLLLPLLTDAQINVAALHRLACFSYVPAPLTPLQSVAAVVPGTEAVWRSPVSCPTGVALLSPEIRSVSQSWQEAPDLLQHEEAAIAQLQHLLKQAMQRQVADLPLDEPVGVLLSGGLDSSLVAALLVAAGMRVRAYALDFGIEGYSELPYAQQVANYFHIPLVRVAATPERLMQVIQATAQALDAPYGDGTTAPLFLLKQAAAREVRVIFNGENGDQLFAGWTNKPLIASGMYGSHQPTGSESFEQQYLQTFQRFYGYESQIFTPALAAQMSCQSLIADLQSALDATYCPSLLARLRRASLMLKGAQNIQPRATALAFAHGLWVRSPFCDPDLTDWTFQLAGELMLQGACEKYILKRAAEHWLPPEIVWREKRGMGVPLKFWYYHQFWGEIGEWLNPGVLQTEGRWQPQIAANFLSGRLGVAMRDRYIGNNLWLLIMWQAWRSSVLGEARSGRSFDHPFWLPPILGQRLLKFYRKSL